MTRKWHVESFKAPWFSHEGTLYRVVDQHGKWADTCYSTFKEAKAQCEALGVVDQHGKWADTCYSTFKEAKAQCEALGEQARHPQVAWYTAGANPEFDWVTLRKWEPSTTFDYGKQSAFVDDYYKAKKAQEELALVREELRACRTKLSEVMAVLDLCVPRGT